MNRLTASLLVLTPLVLVAACGADAVGNGLTGLTSGAGGDDTSGATTSATGVGGAGTGTSVATSVGVGGAGGAGGASASVTTTTTVATTTAASTGSGPNDCNSGPNDDFDMDGYTPATGDCNDCDGNVNPSAVEVLVTMPAGDGGIPAPADEDCDGAIDNLDALCDGNIALTDTNAMNGAAAIDLCKQTTQQGPGWGVISAAYVRANGAAAAGSSQIGIQSAFGPNVATQLGQSMLSLSSGAARIPGQAGACGSNTCSGYGPGTAPAGFPQDVPACAGSTVINDDVGLEVKVRAPSNATGYSFWFDFYSFEYPEWVCTDYNDQFIALVSPPPVGSVNGNISFDSQLNPVSVNVAFFDVCAGCALGTAGLSGTGFDGVWFDDAGATGWLRTQAPVAPNEEITVRFAIWDTGDDAWDSTVLVDRFEWIANGGTVVVDTGHM